MENFIKKIITSQLLIYIFRCLLGFTIGYNLMIQYPHYEPFWGLLSIILVISPEAKDSRKLSKERVKSNLIGSIVGLCCVYINNDPPIYLVMIGIVSTCVICYLFDIMNMARVAIVALIIILIQPHVSNIAITPILRFASVAVGCGIGFLITLFTSMALRKLKKYYNIVE